MTHEELLDEWEKDAEMNKHHLDDEALRIPKLHHKYLKMYMDFKSKKIALNHKLEDLKKEKELYYSGQATADVYKEKPFDLKLKTKGAVQQHVNTDPEVMRLQEKIEYFDILIEGANYIVTQVSFRNQSVKNAVDFIKFQSGGL